MTAEARVRMSLNGALGVINLIQIYIPDSKVEYCLPYRVVYQNKWSLETNLQEQKALCKQQTFYFT